MKKGRSGYVFSVLCTAENIENIERVFFLETTTIGIRKYPVERNELDRQIETISTSFGKINIKKSYYRNQLVNLKPEHDEIVEISRKKNIPLKKLILEINKEIKLYLDAST